MNILLLGGAGLIGRQLEKLLSEDGHKTTVMDNFMTSDGKGYKPVGNIITGNTTMFSNVKPVFSTFSPDVVFHFSECCTDKNGDYDFILESQNKIGTCYSILQSLNLYSVKYIFYGSSCEVFSSPGQKKLHENSKTGGFSYTGKTNDYVEKFFEEASKYYGFKFIPIRYFNVCGERLVPNPKSDIVTSFVDLVLNNVYFDIFGPNSLIDVLDVDDAVKATYLLYKSVVEGSFCGPINIGSGNPIKLIELFEKVNFSITDEKLKPGKMKSNGNVGSFVCDNTLMRSLGWEPSVDIESSIAKVVKFRRGK